MTLGPQFAGIRNRVWDWMTSTEPLPPTRRRVWFHDHGFGGNYGWEERTYGWPGHPARGLADTVPNGEGNLTTTVSGSQSDFSDGGMDGATGGDLGGSGV